MDGRWRKISPKLNRIGPFFNFVGSHLTQARSGVEETAWSMETMTGDGTGEPESADLWAVGFVARRSKPEKGFSLLASRGQNKSLAAPSALMDEMTSGVHFSR